MLAAREYQEDVSAAAKYRKWRQDAIKIPELFDQLQNIINEDPGKWIRFLVREPIVNKKKVEKYVSEERMYSLHSLKNNDDKNVATMKSRRIRWPDCCTRFRNLRPRAGCYSSPMGRNVR